MKGRVEVRILVLVTLALVAFGLVMVYSATSAAAALGDGDPSYYLKRQGIYAVLGICGLLVASRFDFHGLRALAPGLLVFSLVLCTLVLLAPPINGARRWFTLGPAAFQPSELAKLSLAIWAAAYLARRKAPQTLGELARPVGVVAGLFCLLILAGRDLGTAIALVVMLFGLLLVSGVPLRTLGAGTALIGTMGVLAIAAEPYRRERFLSFLDPWSDPQGSGFQIIQALIGLGSGGVFGEGLGQGVQKIFYLPEAHTDMIFAIVGEELGLLGTTAVILAYAAFGYAGLRIALACKDPFGKRLAAALTILVCGQAAINLAAVLALAPLTGIPLPFVSYGGSNLVVQLASVGILLNIAANGSRARASVSDRSRGHGRARAAGAGGRGRAAGRGRRDDLRRVAGARRGAARP
ncbi:MAG: putative lipid II flippase FtsW [Thermoleophilia bacterium]|nr:putative lipid II flippase FtsW [Thermoleophilia bacterium]